MGTMDARFLPFSAQTRMSGVDLNDGARQVRKGAVDAVIAAMFARGLTPSHVLGLR